jgi:MSHA biogenesis protein MshM
MAGALVVAGAGGAVLFLRHVPAFASAQVDAPPPSLPTPSVAPVQAVQSPPSPEPPVEKVQEVVAEAAATPATVDAAQPDLAVRYGALPVALRGAVLNTRRVFDDPAEQGWTLQLGLAGDAVAALRLMARPNGGAPVWVHDRQYGGKAAALWAVYAGRYASREEALAAAVPLASQFQAARPLVRTLHGIRTESYPEHAPK